MKEKLSEEEMRQALFGSVKNDPAPKKSAGKSIASEQRPQKISKSLSPKLRVILRVSREFEGKTESFEYDANTLSTLVAELEAEAEAKKKKFKYFDLVSIKPI